MIEVDLKAAIAALSAELDQAHQAGAALVVERDRLRRDRDAFAERVLEHAKRVSELEGALAEIARTLTRVVG